MAIPSFLFYLVPALLWAAVYLLYIRRRRGTTGTARNTQSVPKKHLPTVTIYSGVLFDDSNTLLPENRASLQKLAGVANIYVIVNVESQEEMDRISGEIAAQLDGVVHQDQILYSQVPICRISMARQLDSVAHIDNNHEVLAEANIFMNAIYIGTAPHQVEKFHADTFTDLIDRTSFTSIFSAKGAHQRHN